MKIQPILNIDCLVFLGISTAALLILFCIIKAKNEITVVISMSIFSLLMTLYHLLLDAPDVALTEASVGACASTVILLYSLVKINKTQTSNKSNLDLGALIIILIFFGLSMSILDFLPKFGDGSSSIHKYLVPDYLKHSGEEIGISSNISSILASYRGFDTFGETLVILIGGISASFILSKKEVS